MATGFAEQADQPRPSTTATFTEHPRPLQLERLLAPHGPYGRVLRPSDGKVPDNIAFVLCAGSRDQSIGVPYCSRVCCMYSIKQAMLLAGSVPMAEITVYYMDIRAFGKGYEQFYQNSRPWGSSSTGARSRGSTAEDDNLKLRVERIEDDGRWTSRSTTWWCCRWAWCPARIRARSWAWTSIVMASSPPPIPSSMCAASVPGLFATGTAVSPKDIVDTVVEASAAAAKVEGFLARTVGARAESSSRWCR